jgi:hypothetical protein
MAINLDMQRRRVEHAGADLLERVKYAQLQSRMTQWKADREAERAVAHAQMVGALPIQTHPKTNRLQLAENRFPTTVEQFHAMSNKHNQLRVARFLTSSHEQQEVMQQAQAWGADTAELMREYHINVRHHRSYSVSSACSLLWLTV